MRKINLLLLLALTTMSWAQQQTLEKGWKFTREDQPQFSQADYNDSKWQKVTLPHDWAIYGPFDRENDLQRIAIKQDGQKSAIEHTGRTGGLPFVGVGWYRTEFDVPELTADKQVFIQFDGAMSNPEVYVNGHKAGLWHNGYNTFFLNISPFVKAQGNTLAVRLNNLPEASRWYPGAGLYRHVHIITKNKTYIPIWGIQLTTPIIEKDFAKVLVNTEFVTDNKANISVETTIFNTKGEKLTTHTTQSTQYTGDVLSNELYINHPTLWDIGKPYLYKAVTKLYENGVVKDEMSTTFGIRSIELKPNDGLYLNGRKIKIQGVCMHHDLGALGGAVNEAAIRRQIRIMQDMGANTIRTSHNMPAPEYVRAADEMGMLLAVESFDDRIDPVGACVGVKGSRVHGIVRELCNENLDVVNYTTNINLFIQRALSPARVSSINIDMENHKAEVYLQPEEVSLAIGRGGLNIKLASMLTEYTIDVFRELDEQAAEEDIYLDEFSDEIDKWVIDAIKSIGLDTARQVLNAPREMLIEKADLEEETVDNVLNILRAEFES